MKYVLKLLKNYIDVGKIERSCDKTKANNIL